MTYTVLLFLYRKPGLSLQAFKDHYEKNHMPLLMSFALGKAPKTHTRHYIERPNAGSANTSTPATVLMGSQEDFDYDSITQLDFEDAGAFQKYHAATIGSERVAAEITKDEEKFLDRGRTKVVVAGESLSTPRPGTV